MAYRGDALSDAVFLVHVTVHVGHGINPFDNFQRMGLHSFQSVAWICKLDRVDCHILDRYNMYS